MHRQVAYFSLIQVNCPSVFSDQPANNIETRCLTGPIWPEKANYLTAIDFEINLIDYSEVLETFNQALCFKKGQLIVLLKKCIAIYAC